jgi:hypothetical protein
MPKRSVADIEPGKTDQRGKKIDEVYSSVSGLFAVFCSGNEVTIQYADDDEQGSQQRKALSPIRPLRGEIDGLVRKLMQALSPPDQADTEEKRFYDRQVADALFMGLQGDVDQCRILLESVRDAVRERLLSVGRMQVAKWTLYSTLFVLGFFGLLVLVAGVVGYVFSGAGSAADAAELLPPRSGDGVFAFVTDTHLWAAAVFGALGAWLSIAIGLRHREVIPSTSKLDNIVDPTLRIIVAVLSAMVLFSLVHLGAFEVRFGDIAIAWPDKDDGTWRGIHVAIILGIVAGFSERLVGNLVARGELGERRAASDTPSAGSNQGTDERNPAGGAGTQGAPSAATTVQVAAAAAAATAAAAAAVAEEAEDQSLDANPAQEDEQTPDEDLPAATGGVASDDDPG